MSLFTVETADDAPVTNYVATIRGIATKAEQSETVSSVGESNDRIESQYGYTTIYGETSKGWGDAFDVTGEIIDVHVTGDPADHTVSGTGQDTGSEPGPLDLDLGWSDYAIAAAVIGYMVFG